MNNIIKISTFSIILALLSGCEPELYDGSVPAGGRVSKNGKAQVDKSHQICEGFLQERGPLFGKYISRFPYWSCRVASGMAPKCPLLGGCNTQK
jgi:hypothetical protein